MDDIVDYVVGLSRRHYDEIGFLPESRLRSYQERGQLWHASENGELCGFLVWGNGWPVLRVYQVCIQYDVRRRQHGLELVRKLITLATANGYSAIACWVADDIPANDFWRSCGFEVRGQRQGGRARGRNHNQWVFHLPMPKQLSLV